MPSDPRDIEAVALLDEPVRRALYEWVAARPEAVGRDEAATAVGVTRALAAFHLDRLARDGLLDTEYRRLTGRTGPGAGRPAKLYRRASRDIAVSLPDRRYETAARVMADAIERAGAEVPPPAVRAAAYDAGREIGTAARTAAGPRPGRRRRRTALLETLGDRGYAPHEPARGEIVLGNCPFDALVDEHRQLVCGMNLALAEGVLDGLGEDTITPRLEVEPGRCCVVFRDEGTAD
jgi:predicted ArsR family transcriptional regulator